jgi:hypothetical protein
MNRILAPRLHRAAYVRPQGRQKASRFGAEHQNKSQDSTAPSSYASSALEFTSTSRGSFVSCSTACVSRQSLRAASSASMPDCFHHAISSLDRWTSSMMGTTQRHDELVADLATKCWPLGESKVIGIRWLTTTDQARAFGYVLNMHLIAQTARLWDRKQASPMLCGRRAMMSSKPSIKTLSKLSLAEERGMISARKLRANRANSRRSTGPRTVAGRATAARNSRRHGLAIPIPSDPALSAQVEAMAQMIAGNNPRS